MSDLKMLIVFLILLLLLSAISVVCCAHLKTKTDIVSFYFFVSDSNTILAVGVGIIAFLLFKNIHIPYNRIINTVAASTFGVLLIHANSNTMRQWLWKDTLNNVSHYGDKLMPLYAVGCVLVVYIACTAIDIIRFNLLEKPFFKWWDKHCDGFYKSFKMKENKMFQKLHID